MRTRHTRLFILVAALAASGSAFAANDDVATLTRLSQAFSDASAGGDAKMLDRLLDERVVFMAEDGSIYGKHDIVAGASPPPKGISNKLVQSDFAVELHDDVAVTRFTDNATFNVYGQVAHERFRSTEVWLREKDGWKMISSQTLAMPEDPPHVSLPAGDLDQYAGSYAMAPGHAIRVEHRGDGLFLIGHDGKPKPLLAEVRDVLFVPGQPRVRWIAERDHAGKVIALDRRREGIDMQRYRRG